MLFMCVCDVFNDLISRGTAGKQRPSPTNHWCFSFYLSLLKQNMRQWDDTINTKHVKQKVGCVIMWSVCVKLCGGCVYLYCKFPDICRSEISGVSLWWSHTHTHAAPDGVCRSPLSAGHWCCKWEIIWYGGESLATHNSSVKMKTWSSVTPWNLPGHDTHSRRERIFILLLLHSQICCWVIFYPDCWVIFQTVG